MNLGKAKDYFSAYYEGSLERGLKQSFEARLREDAQLQAEYRAFERTMNELGALGRIEIEPPADLHEKIAARLDRAVWEQQRQKTPAGGLTWWKALILGAAVATCVFVALFRFNGGAGASQASAVPIPEAQAQFKFTSDNGITFLQLQPVDHATVVIKDGDGAVKDSFVLDHQGIDGKRLVNNADNAQLLSVETADQSGLLSYVALPGKKVDHNTSGKGTVKDLALALAGHYEKPVVVQARQEADMSASWDLNSDDAEAAANSAVKDLNLSVTEDKNGLLLIQKN